MIRPLLVATSHSLDLLTLLLVLQLYPIGGEWNVVARTGGPEATVLLKVAGTLALICLVTWDRWPWFHRVSLPIAAGSGALYASVNVASIYVLLGGFHVLP